MVSIKQKLRLNILFISSWYPTPRNPLMGIFVKRHAAAIALCCNVSVITVNSSDHAGIEESEEGGIFTLRAYYKQIGTAIPFLSSAVKLYQYLNTWIMVLKYYRNKKQKPDIVNANIVYPISIVAWFIQIFWRVPYVITEHWTGYFPADGRYKGIIMKWLSRLAVGKAASVITVSEGLSKRMKELKLSNTYHIIPNAVDINIFDISNYNNNSIYNFIHISTLDNPQKNITGMIHAFKRVNSAFPNTKLTLVWEEQSDEYIELIRREAAFNDSIIITGRKTPSEIIGMLHNSCAMVLFSNYENLPCVMLEALSCGVPVIATNVGDIPLYINSSNGLLVKPGDEAGLEHAMTTLIKNQESYNPTAIRASVIDKVNPAAIAEQFLKVYKEALNPSNL